MPLDQTQVRVRVRLRARGRFRITLTVRVRVRVEFRLRIRIMAGLRIGLAFGRLTLSRRLGAGLEKDSHSGLGLG